MDFKLDSPAFTVNDEMREVLDGVPQYGFRVKLDHRFPEDKVKPLVIPRLKQIPSFLGLAWRYLLYWNKKRRAGKRCFIDIRDAVPCQQIYGVPIGGIGCGSIGRGFRGEFCRFQMIPGMYKWRTVDSDQFIVCVRRRGQTVYQQVLNAKPAPPKGRLKAWRWSFDGAKATYHGLYPRAWTVYDLPGQGIRLTCRQVSPIIPNDYQDSSLPTALFVWTIDNMSEEDAEVSIVLTFKNGMGCTHKDRLGGTHSELFARDGASEGADGSTAAAAAGVLLHQKLTDMPCTYVVAAKVEDPVHVTCCSHFDPCSDGAELWQQLLGSGRLAEDPRAGRADVTSRVSCSGDGSQQHDEGASVGAAITTAATGRPPTAEGKETAVAVCVGRLVPAGCRGASVELCLAWYMPEITFGSGLTRYSRRYARWFSGPASSAAPAMVGYALAKRNVWENKIDAWQQPVLGNKCLPAWYKSALFNELYFISDGGSVWLDPAPSDASQPQQGMGSAGAEQATSDIVKTYGKFAYLEGHEYRMYNTYDVHFYASFALVMLWPYLQLSLQYDMAQAIPKDSGQTIQFCMNGVRGVTKAKNCVPHDIGDPEDEPWSNVNCYVIHPTHDWKDLNTKFVLQVYRDYHMTKSLSYLEGMFPIVLAVMETALQFDTDGDGVIENGGYADQTYDAWVATGTSAYCGGLWLAALKAIVTMSGLLKRADVEQRFGEILARGARSFDTKLWNGKYYNYDTGSSSHSDSIMADQLCGQWYLRACGLDDEKIFDGGKVRSALATVFASNVLPFRSGCMGAVNGARPGGHKDTHSVQSEEFWTGVTYALAATMIQQGMLREAFQTAYGAYHTVYEQRGLGFQTPEAYMEHVIYRSLGYMRPLSIWSMQWALQQYHPDIASGARERPFDEGIVDDKNQQLGALSRLEVNV